VSCCGQRAASKGFIMFIGLAVLLLIIWVVCFLVLHITAFAIHILIILAVIAFIAHFFRGRAA
jgi:hypothetical protein